MTRIIMRPRDGQGSYRTTWFETEKATAVFEHPAVMFPDGYNFSGAHPQRLYLTAGGLWALETGANLFQWIDPDEARDWLISSRIPDEQIARHLAPVEEERGPGRPGIGGAAHVRYGEERLSRVDAYAGRHGINRAEALRQLVDHALLVITGEAS